MSGMWSHQVSRERMSYLVQFIHSCSSFCSSEHGALHEDQGQCLPYSVTSLAGVGRCLVAARDITAGELIFREEALAIGPNHDTPPLCLSCLKVVNPAPSERWVMIALSFLVTGSPALSATSPCARRSAPLESTDSWSAPCLPRRRGSCRSATLTESHIIPSISASPRSGDSSFKGLYL